MTRATYRAKFVDGTGRTFLVDEVCQTVDGLVVYYHREDTEQQYSCRLEAFSQRFREVEND